MKKLLIFLFLLTTPPCDVVWASAPTRPNTYTTGTTIRASDVTLNETTLYNYLQAGVDTYVDGSILSADIFDSTIISADILDGTIATGDIADGTIVNADVSTSAAIAYSKLSLSESVVSGDITDGTIVNADVNSSAAIVASKLDLTSPGGIGTTAAAAGKFTTLEATSTLKLGTTNQGDILYDNGTSLVRLTPGTLGQFLQTQGASANPQWASGLILTGTASFSAATTTGTVTITSGKHYRVLLRIQSDGSANSSAAIEFNGDTTSTNYNVHSIKAVNTTLTSVNGNSNLIPDSTNNTIAIAGEEGVVDLNCTTDQATALPRCTGTISAGDIGQTDNVLATVAISYNTAPTSIAFRWANNATGVLKVWEMVN